MSYLVKVMLNNMDKLEGEFYHVMIDDNSEIVFLFKEGKESRDGVDKVIRYTIPLNRIESLEISPIYEDNEQKISSC